VQSIGSGHSTLGAVINCRGNRHLTRRINSRPAAAGRPFRCGCASTTRAPLCAGVNGKGFGLLGGSVPLALVPGLVAKSAEFGEHQGRQSPRLIWLHHSATELVVDSVFAVLGRPPTIYSGSDTFEYRFIHRWLGGGFKQTVSALAGARKWSRPSWSLPGSRQCQYLPLTSQLSSLPA